MDKKICKICNEYNPPFNYYKSLGGYFCQKCKESQNQLNLNANTFNIKKLIERLEIVENLIQDKQYEVVIDIQPLDDQLGVSKQKCAELIANEVMRIVFPIQ